MGNKITLDLVVNNKLGLHARPSSSVVKKAASFQSEILFTDTKGNTVNGKSIMGLMMLSAGQGSKLILSAEGSDAHEAVYAISKLFENKFNED